MSLTAQDLLSAPVRVTKEIELPVRGGTVHVRALFAVEAVALSEALDKTTDTNQRIAIKAAAFLSDASGNALLTVEQARDALTKLYSHDTQAIIRSGERLNAADDEAVETAAKN